MIGKTNAVVNVSSGGVDVVSTYEYLKNYQFAYTNITSYTNNKVNNMPQDATYVFGYCSNLKYVSIPNINQVSSSCFRHCSSLTSVDISNITYIGQRAFQGCSSLKKVVFNVIVVISQNAFKDSGLEEMTIGTNQVCTVDTTSFNGITKVIVKVPSNLIENYKVATNWSTLYNNGQVDFLAITE